MASSYYRQADAILLMYAINSKSSFTNLQRWMQAIDRYAREDVLVMLVGCKGDLFGHREVDAEEAQAFAEGYGMKFVETSSLNGYNVEEAFSTCAEIIQKSKENGGSGLQLYSEPIEGAAGPCACF